MSRRPRQAEQQASSAIDWQAVAAIEIHPLRRAILLAAAHTAEVSPAGLATDFNEPVGSVAYHVRRLKLAGVLREVRTEQVRGAVAHWYELVDEFRTPS